MPSFPDEEPAALFVVALGVEPAAGAGCAMAVNQCSRRARPRHGGRLGDAAGDEAICKVSGMMKNGYSAAMNCGASGSAMSGKCEGWSMSRNQGKARQGYEDEG